ncbi:hypothetical protein AB0E07_10810, partial [Streptomyces sp. NPDC048002]
MNRANQGDADETTVLPTHTRPHGTADQGRADLTELLSAFDRFDGAQPAPAPAPGGRRPRPGAEAFTPREPRAAGEPAPAREQPADVEAFPHVGSEAFPT